MGNESIVQAVSKKKLITCAHRKDKQIRIFLELEEQIEEQQIFQVFCSPATLIDHAHYHQLHLHQGN